jgi:hypothetical protein
MKIIKHIILSHNQDAQFVPVVNKDGETNAQLLDRMIVADRIKRQGRKLHIEMYQKSNENKCTSGYLKCDERNFKYWNHRLTPNSSDDEMQM